MKLGTMKDRLARSLAGADLVYCYAAELGWDPAQALAPLGDKRAVCSTTSMGWSRRSCARCAPGDHVLVMSNGGFGGVHDRLLARLARSSAAAST